MRQIVKRRMLLKDLIEGDDVDRGCVDVKEVLQ